MIRVLTMVFFNKGSTDMKSGFSGHGHNLKSRTDISSENGWICHPYKFSNLSSTYSGSNFWSSWRRFFRTVNDHVNSIKKTLLIQFKQLEGGSTVIFRTVRSHVIIISKRNLAGSKVNWHAYASRDHLSLPPPTGSKVGPPRTSSPTESCHQHRCNSFY